MRLRATNANIYIAGHRGMVVRSSGELDLRDPHATRSFFEAERTRSLGSHSICSA